MDFDDSPDEAAFRARFRAWLIENNPGLPASSTDDEYWAKQAEWHCALFDAGFFALTWPAEYGGQGLSPVYEVIVDEELAAAGAAEAEPRVSHPGDQPARERRDLRPVPACVGQRSGPLVPGVQRTRRRLGSRVVADPGGARR